MSGAIATTEAKAPAPKKRQQQKRQRPKAETPRAEPTAKAAIELNIGQTLSTGTLGGKTFDAIPGGDVSIYTTEPFEQKTADEAAPASATDIEIDVRKDSRGVAAHGVKIELNPEGIPVISLEKGKKLSVEPTFSNDTAAAEADGVALNVTEERIRVTLPGGEVFDITPDGNATTYGDSVQRKTADATPLNAEEYQRVTIRDRFNAVAMNNSSIELTDGALAIATDGISKAKKPAAVVETPTEPADPNSDKANWVDLGKSPTTKVDFFVAPKDVDGTKIYDDAEKAAEYLRSQGFQDARVPSKREMKIIEKAERDGLVGEFDKTGSGYRSRYWTSTRWSIFPGQKVTQGFADDDRVQANGVKKQTHATRFVCS